VTARISIGSVVQRARLRTHSARRDAPVEPTVALVGLLVLTVAAMALAVGEVGWFPLSFFMLPLVLGGLLLRRLQIAVLSLVVLACALATISIVGFSTARVSALAVMALIAIAVYLSSGNSRLGGRHLVGESMIIDLRDRLRQQGELPELPPQWYAQAVMRSAYGASFAGDFIVAAKTRTSLLEVVVVDVSGKGLAAGTRALQLSGAMGGLLGALPPAEFLRAANAYLLRQDWDEGFATAAHLALSLDTGSFEVRTAGHPPAVQWLAGSGRWKVHASAGPVLGVLDEADYEPVLGQVSQGDVVIMYTDGMVETRFQDFTMGIDKMVGQAERLMGGGWLNSAERLLEGVNEPGDDRAIFVVNRR
jgi:hypothetical protein